MGSGGEPRSEETINFLTFNINFHTMKKLLNVFAMLTLFAFCLIAPPELSAQDGSTGTLLFDSVTSMNAFTPDVSRNEAQLALVTSATVSATVYEYDRVSSAWKRVGDISVQDGTTIDLTYVGNVLTAEVAQNGAETGQAMTWNGSSWVPDDITVSATDVNFTSGNFTATDVGAALEELFTSIDGTFAVGGVFNSDAEAASGSIALNDFYTAGDNHRDGVREGTVIRRNN